MERSLHPRRRQGSRHRRAQARLVLHRFLPLHRLHTNVSRPGSSRSTRATVEAMPRATRPCPPRARHAGRSAGTVTAPCPHTTPPPARRSAESAPVLMNLPHRRQIGGAPHTACRSASSLFDVSHRSCSRSASVELSRKPPAAPATPSPALRSPPTAPGLSEFSPWWFQPPRTRVTRNASSVGVGVHLPGAHTRKPARRRRRRCRRSPPPLFPSAGALTCHFHKSTVSFSCCASPPAQAQIPRLRCGSHPPLGGAQNLPQTAKVQCPLRRASCA